LRNAPEVAIYDYCIESPISLPRYKEIALQKPPVMLLQG
jgi:hypothetical protein